MSDRSILLEQYFTECTDRRLWPLGEYNPPVLRHDLAIERVDEDIHDRLEPRCLAKAAVGSEVELGVLVVDCRKSHHQEHRWRYGQLPDVGVQEPSELVGTVALILLIEKDQDATLWTYPDLTDTLGLDF